MEIQIIYDGRKVQVWEFVYQGLNIGKWSTGKHCDGVAVVKNVKTIMCQDGGTLPLSGNKTMNQSLFVFLLLHAIEGAINFGAPCMCVTVRF